MNKTNQFSAKTQYVTPWCRITVIRAAKCILAGSLMGGSDSLEGMNSRDTSGWAWDEEE